MPEPGASGATEPFLSLVVMTRNEESNIADLLANAQGVDEVVVADMESVDDTVRIAEAAGARVLRLPNAGFAEPGRMDAIRFAKGPWVLALDADERLPAGGVEAVRSLCQNAPTTVSAFRIPRTNYLGERAIRGSGWGPETERHARLFRADQVSWAPRVHSAPEFEGGIVDLPDGGVIRIEHANFRDYSHLLEKLNGYSSIEAAELVEAGAKPTLAMALRFALEELIGRYDPEHDGALSLPLALAMFSYRFSSSAKAVEARGWDDEPVIDRAALLSAINAFWSELRRQQLSITRATTVEGDVDEIAHGERVLAVWAAMPAQLRVDAATIDDQGTYELPLLQIDGDLRAQGVVEALESLRVRTELRRERHARKDAEALVEKAERDRDEAVDKLAEVAETLRDALARTEMLEKMVAEAQSREAEAQKPRELSVNAAPTAAGPPGFERMARGAARRLRRRLKP